MAVPTLDFKATICGLWLSDPNGRTLARGPDAVRAYLLGAWPTCSLHHGGDHVNVIAASGRCVATIFFDLVVEPA